MHRSGFLARVREGLRSVEVPPLPAELPPTPASGDGRLFDRFADELGRLGGAAVRMPRGELAAAVAGAAGEAATAVVADDLGPYREEVRAGLGRAGCRVEPPTREAAASADLGVTGAVLGVASTGSVLLVAGPRSPRVASLLPPAHLAVLPEDRLVPGFEELFAALPELAARASSAVLITGPSRTADIEQTIVRGVHGPHAVTVLVVAD